MQLKTTKESLGVKNQPSAITLEIAPKSSPGYLVAGIAIGAVSGFIAGSILTLLIGEKSLLLVQHLWNRITSGHQDGERVHFELLLQ
ncbi:MAG TPA: hypothetical protein VJ183_06515 [Chloroflexia bacterium]|nr:hypothetical protein [Chloroflexia bacterium]